MSKRQKVSGNMAAAAATAVAEDGDYELGNCIDDNMLLASIDANPDKWG